MTQHLFFLLKSWFLILRTGVVKVVEHDHTISKSTVVYPTFVYRSLRTQCRSELGYLYVRSFAGARRPVHRETSVLGSAFRIFSAAVAKLSASVT